MTDLELYEEMVRLTRRSEPFALATVIASSGSSPRKAGAKMLVRVDGSFLGTVGGGRVEKESVEAALGALMDERPRTLDYVLTAEKGFACGGSMTVYIEPQGRRPLLGFFLGGHFDEAKASRTSRVAVFHDCR